MLLPLHLALLSTCIGGTDMLITFFNQLFGASKVKNILVNFLTYENENIIYESSTLFYIPPNSLMLNEDLLFYGNQLLTYGA